MALLLKEKDVEQLLTMNLALERVERVHREYSAGEAIDVPRERTRLPRAALHILQGAVPSAGVFGYKAYTSSREGIRFIVYVFSAERGNLEGIVEANLLGMIRTGAAGGVAVRLLSRPESKVAGVFGAGWQARGQVEALAAVRKLERVKVYSRNPDKLAKFCVKMRERLGLDVVPAASAEETVRGSDVVVTITTAATPVFSGDWVEPGQHINAAGSNSLLRQEIDETTVRKCAPIVVDSRPTALKEAGDLLPAFEKGRISLGQVAELGEVLNGTRPGRTDPGQVTLFESQGMAIQDLAIAAELLVRARAAGLGSEVDVGA
ncbi:MAG: ornithine cyclodeaminase family protein [Betaproteobacteria bacterium]|nr:ornithine cyclodeaminase family protein [Betaproteobacteria bacterium]